MRTLDPIEGAAASLRLAREQRPSPAAGGNASPLITVVVCAYRHAAYIDECLASVDATDPATPIELIVVDDGSPDDTLAKCLAFPFRADLRLRVYTKPNQGLVHTLRCALEIAEGRYLAVMASDDAYVLGGLEAAHRSVVEAPVGGLLCQAVYIGEVDRPLVYGPWLQSLFRQTPSARLKAVCTEIPKPLLLQASLFDLRLLRETGIWRDGLELDDWPTFVRIFMAEAAGRATVRYQPEIVLCAYRRHAEGVHNNLARQLRLTEQIASVLIPGRWRRECLANVRIDIGLIHLHRGNRREGLWLCIRGLLHWPAPAVLGRVFRRARDATLRRWRGSRSAQRLPA